jgi:putative MATE family efflux protein
MQTTYTYAQIGKVAYPIFLTMLIQNFIQVVSTAFLGHVGEVELGASAIAGIFYIVIFIVAFGFSMGAQILIGRRNGEKNYTRIGEIFLYGTVFLWIIALFIYFFTRWSSEPVLSKLLQSPNVLKASVEYLDWRINGLFFVSVNVMFRAFYVGIIRTKVLTFNAITMAVTNVFFDYVLIFGKWGFPEMGIKGAALAAVISEAVSTVFFIIYMFVFIDLKKYGFIGVGLKNIRVIRNILNVSTSLMIQFFLALCTWLFFFLAIEGKGETDLAISNIIRSFYMIFGIHIFALSATASTLVSNVIGAGKSNEVIPLIWKISRLSLLISSVLIVILYLFPEPLLKLYTSNPELVSGAIPSLHVLLIILMAYSVGNVIFQSVSGTGNTRSALIIESFVIGIYIVWVWFTAIHLKAPLFVCWTVEIMYSVLIGFLSFLYFRYGKWEGKKI